ncbi:MAG TPA: M20/M25/M40 family metallo-hydrolase [Falsiroseomonas sp.]|jgi:acetylornithine deacetylase|nr:M20/M25/M40 family metallo-hydrolase [Falsiroseomonas sp.]
MTIPGFQSVTAGTLVHWTRQVARMPSEQTAQMEGDPAIAAFIEGVTPLLADTPVTLRRDAMGNLLAEAGPEGTPALGFFAYAMTHPRSSMRDPFAGELLGAGEAAEIRGRGVSEQKASLVATLAAFRDLARSGALKRRLAWCLLTAGETGRHDAIRTALDALGSAPEHGIVAIGTGGRISLGNRGRVDLHMTITGVACHSSTPWRGVDVTRGVRLVLEKAEAISPGLGADAVLGPATLTCTAIRTAPDATHTVQSEARLTFDRRLLPGEDPEVVLAGLRESLALPAPLGMVLERGAYMLGCRIAAEAPFVRLIEDAMETDGLSPPGAYHSGGALDAGYLAHRGIAGVMWGPGDPDMFHTDEESVRVSDLVTAARAYRAVAAQLAT